MAKFTKEQYETAAKHGVSMQLLHNRVNQYKWDVDKAMTTPPKTSKEIAQNASNHAKKKRFNTTSDSWFADGNNSALRCPVPDCGHVGQIITKVHCRMAHGMERDEVKELYGMPTKLDVKIRKVENK